MIIVYCGAQNPLVKIWDKRFGGTDQERIGAFQQTSDGGYLLGGASHSPLSGDLSQSNWDPGGFTDDFWVVKIDSLGIKQWDKRFGGTADDYMHSLKQTSDGGYLFGGYTLSGISGDKSEPSWGGHDIWIVKIDSIGNKQWDKRYGGTSNDDLYQLILTTDGGYLLGGFTTSDSSGDMTQHSWGGTDYWIVKIDSTGNKQWDKRFGGSGSDYLFSVIQTNDGGFMLGGESNSEISGDKTEANWDTSGSTDDYWIVRIDMNGNKLWDKRYGGTKDDYFSSIEQTNDGGYILGGISISDIDGDKTQPSLGLFDYWIIKVDSSGNKQWDKRFGGNDEETLSSVSQTIDGGYFLAGTSYSSISGDKTENNFLGPVQTWILKTDATGLKEWDKTVFTNGTDWQAFGFETQQGNYAIANCTDGGIAGYKTQPSWGSNDFWIITFEDTTISNCFSHFTALYDSTYNVFSLTLDSITSLQATGYFWNFGDSTTSNQQYPTHIYATNALYNVCLTITNSSGDTCSYCHIIGIDSNGGIHTLINNGFTLSVVNPALGIAENSYPDLYICPNPAHQQFTLILNNHYQNATIEITNLLGRFVCTKKINEADFVKINLNEPPGFYFVSVVSDKQKHTYKLILE